jgi:predicted membrane chloride channel (bestrophin family)
LSLHLPFIYLLIDNGLSLDLFIYLKNKMGHRVDARSAPNKSVNQQWGLHREASVEVRSSSTANTHDFVPLASALAPHNVRRTLRRHQLVCFYVVRG